MNVDIPMSFKLDAFIYSLFSNYCCSVKLENGELRNSLFWMSVSEIMELANEFGLDETYEQARLGKESFAYEFIQSHLNEFSPEARAVLDKATELVKKSFRYRFLFDQDHPEFQVNNWDCGFYQLKQIWKEYLKDDFNEFKELYKAFSQKMLPQVYELGFLKK